MKCVRKSYTRESDPTILTRIDEAAKEHKCSKCKCIISVGVPYFRETGTQYNMRCFFTRGKYCIFCGKEIYESRTHGKYNYLKYS